MIFMQLPKETVKAGYEQWPGGLHIHYQLSPEELVEQCLSRGEGSLGDNGALCINTGVFTGRNPKDKYIAADMPVEGLVDYNHFNASLSPAQFNNLHRRMRDYLQRRPELWIRDCIAGSDPEFALQLRVVNETPAANLFCYNMFLRPAAGAVNACGWQLLQAPRFTADPARDGTRSPHFVVISFAERLILIGGTAYTGEMKKAMFSVLNLLLPLQQVLTMHCSANRSASGDTALFFGLSGTGKTTLSADPGRSLIGDDEHGWSGKGIFNLEGGCYAKLIGLSAVKEPAIYKAIQAGSLVENTVFYPGTNHINFGSAAITENTRASYPLNFIEGAACPSSGPHPSHIFFLTCDAYGVLPPISRLTKEQAMYHFLLGYTAKVAGTETGVSTPKATFSPCFGAPFLPMHPGHYAMMLGERLSQHKATVWLVNTGWTGGGVGTGSRIALSLTRAMIQAALAGELDKVPFRQEPYFGLYIPGSCPGVPATVLDPQAGWADKEAYTTAALDLQLLFKQNEQTNVNQRTNTE
jgi:phosphoenolpyruvate carboxykinase (ATP)